jgi:hypothetical protein
MQGKFSWPIVLMELTRWTDKSLLDMWLHGFRFLFSRHFRNAEILHGGTVLGYPKRFGIATAQWLNAIKILNAAPVSFIFCSVK